MDVSNTSNWMRAKKKQSRKQYNILVRFVEVVDWGDGTWKDKWEKCRVERKGRAPKRETLVLRLASPYSKQQPKIV